MRGRHTLYDPAIHIPLLHRVFENGGIVETFCSEAGIVRRTFHYWTKANPDFQMEYQKAIMKATNFYHLLAHNNLNIRFSSQYLGSLMQNRFVTPFRHKTHLKYLVEAKTDLERKEAVWRHVVEGDITAEEGKKLMDLVVSSLSIEDMTIIKDKVNMLCEKAGIT